MTRLMLTAASTIAAALFFAEGWPFIGAIWVIIAALNGTLFALGK